MKKDSVILTLLIVVSVALSFSIGALWRSEQIIRLRMKVDDQKAIFSQTELYLNQFNFNDIAKNNWRQLEYNIYSKNDSINLK